MGVTLEERERFCQRLYDAARPYQAYAPEEYPETDKDVSIARKRRQRRRWEEEDDDPRQSMTLTESDDGVLRWESGYGYAQGPQSRRGRRARVVSGDSVTPINFARLEEGQLAGYLRNFDSRLNPDCNLISPELGLRRLEQGANGPAWGKGAVKPAGSGRILIFIHGTFSKNQPFLDQLTGTAAGSELLRRALNSKNYQQVLGFEHPTLSVSPWINALDLSRMFADSSADIDVVAHSRGGLVARWWLEEMDYRKAGTARAVLVGSPLAGTSLASPPRLRAALNLLTNVMHVLETGAHLGATAFPFLEVVAGLLKIVGSIGTITAKTPLVDATMAVVPGLSAQSKMGNNSEIGRLNQISRVKAEYFAVTSHFEPQDVGWAFWRYFTQIEERLEGAAADLVFDEPNDLVVDTPSMVTLSSQQNPPTFKKVQEFDKKDGVYHTIYFSRPETAQFITDMLGLK